MSAVPPDAYLPQYSVEEETDPDERLKVRGSSIHVYEGTFMFLHVYLIVLLLDGCKSSVVQEINEGVYFTRAANLECKVLHFVGRLGAMCIILVQDIKCMIPVFCTGYETACGHLLSMQGMGAKPDSAFSVVPRCTPATMPSFGNTSPRKRSSPMGAPESRPPDAGLEPGAYHGSDIAPSLRIEFHTYSGGLRRQPRQDLGY